MGDFFVVCGSDNPPATLNRLFKTDGCFGNKGDRGDNPNNPHVLDKRFRVVNYFQAGILMPRQSWLFKGLPMPRLFLCEKPSQARDIALVLGATQRLEGCWSGPEQWSLRS